LKEILHIRHHFLPLSETFIYKDIINIKNFSINLFCLRRINEKIFPWDNLYQPVFWENFFYRLGRKSATLKRIIKEKAIKLIHCHFGVEGVYGLYYKKEFSLPLVVSFHGFEFFVPFHRKYANPTFYNYCRYYQELIKEGDIFLCVSEATKRDLISLGYPPEKVLTLYLGIDLENLPVKERSSNKAVNIVFVGRLTEKKGILFLIDAFQNIAQKYQEARLIIVGDGELKKKVLKKIKGYRLKEKVIFKGALPNKETLEEMTKADIFILPSYKTADGNQEGTPYTLFEAQGIGLPVISTFHSGIPEIVQDGETGFLVKEKDIKGIEEKLSLLIENPALRREMGEKGREFMKNFSLKKRIEKLEAIYKSLIL